MTLPGSLHRWPVSGAMMALLAACGAPAIVARPVGTLPASSASAAARAAPAVPARLGDSAFWKLESDVSEPGGYFRIEDNYTSNETEVGRLFTMLRETGVQGGVYLGVGPEQNFTYIAAIRPQMAFVVDIRRQAVMQHLMFKAMFELAADRADFISILFGKPRPRGIDSTTPIQRIWDAFMRVPTDSALSSRNYVRIVDRLTKTHGFTFTPDESEKLKAVFNAFYYYGPGITTRGAPSRRGGDFVSLTAYSNDSAGQARSFLTSEENYRIVKSLQDRNLIVPVSGDFGGPKTVRAIGAYLKEHDGTVTAFYVSNVEQYLFGDGKAGAFYANVAALPVDSTSVFIRPFSMRRWFGGVGSRVQSLCPIAPFVRAALAGRVPDNNTALACALIIGRTIPP